MENFRPNQLACFIAKLEKLPKQQQQALIEKLLQQAIRTQGRMDLKQRLNQIHLELYPKLTSTRQLPRRPWYSSLGWAAAAVFFFFFPFWWLSSPMSSQALVEQYYETYELSLLVRDGDQNAAILMANELYQQKKYREAIPAFEQALQANSQSQLYLGLGISYWKSGDLEKAKEQFKQLSDLQDPLLKDQATWYLGLLALEQNNEQQARFHLEILCAQPGADHHLAAKKIMEQLN